MMTEQYRGLVIRNKDHAVRLKWHRLRRSLADPLFSKPILRQGCAMGASMELDLRVRSDFGFVALHDATLDRETDGTGPVAAASAEDLRGLRMQPGDHAPLLSEDIAGLLSDAHPDALLQLDMKDPYDAIGPRGIEHLQRHFAGTGNAVIVSARDLDLIVAIKTGLPDVRRGIDPTDALIEILRDEGAGAAEARLRRDILGPTEPDTVYLAWPLLLAAAEAGLDMIGVSHDLGRDVDAWTFNLKNPDSGFDDAEARDFARLMALCPDQITTDEPGATERAWNRLAGAVS